MSILRRHFQPGGSVFITCATHRRLTIFVETLPNTHAGLPALSQNHLNPFNPTTTISLSLPVASEWSITIYNIRGQMVDEFHGESEPGVVSVVWNASKYASGICLYKAVAGEFTATRKMALVK